MSYEATVFNVMIASPGDVASERAIVREVIAEWNVIHSARRRIVLLPTSWETHSSPEMGTTPQAIINKQILDKSDLLIGVFWTRIGTQTAEYASGSVEEIERHISSGKPVMLYFSTQPARFDSVDDDQYRELKKFRESCKERSLYETYDIGEKDRRSTAKWEAALKQLIEEELVAERGNKGESFEITEHGYQIAEFVEL